MPDRAATVTPFAGGRAPPGCGIPPGNGERPRGDRDLPRGLPRDKSLRVACDQILQPLPRLLRGDFRHAPVRPDKVIGAEPGAQGAGVLGLEKVYEASTRWHPIAAAHGSPDGAPSTPMDRPGPRAVPAVETIRGVPGRGQVTAQVQHCLSSAALPSAVSPASPNPSRIVA